MNKIDHNAVSGNVKSDKASRRWFCGAILFYTVLTAGCSSMPPGTGVTLNAMKADLSDTRTTKRQLYLQYRQWKGTPYVFGGLSRKGIDCSGFVYATYRERFGIRIPRTTRLLSHSGDQIERGERRPGDLVFFKTGVKVRHVGIYLGDNRFMHASTTKGVMISDMGAPYWKARYWQTRRIGL